MEQFPLVSILTNCKNARGSIRRCLDSVVALDYPNLEYLINDGASTDGTLEILTEYRDRYPQLIRLVSERDSSSAEGFFRAIRRCNGEIIGTCLADEELLPFAARWAVQLFQYHGSVDAVHGDIYNTDLEGRIHCPNHSGPFDVVAYFGHEMTPHFAASFFRRASLQQMGLFSDDWRQDIGEFGIWGTLGLNGYKVIYTPEILTKYAIHSEEESERIDILHPLVQGRGEYLDALFQAGELPPRVLAEKNRIYAGYHRWAAANFRKHGHAAALYHTKMAALYQVMMAKEAA
jgi:glycosyltransferase involved in cell wall biosynthesis